MTRDELIEAMARAIWPEDFYPAWNDAQDPRTPFEFQETLQEEIAEMLADAGRVLAALETALSIDLTAIAEGRAVVVPVEPDDGCIIAMRLRAWETRRAKHG